MIISFVLRPFFFFFFFGEGNCKAELWPSRLVLHLLVMEDLRLHCQNAISLM